MKRAIVVVPLLGVAALLGLFAYSLVEGPLPNALPSVLIGKPVPTFALPPLEEGSAGLSNTDLANGQVHIVNFWASWCLPCQVEHPLLMTLSGRAGFSLVGINYKDKTDAALAQLGRLGNPFDRIGRDADGRTAIDWGVSGVPETFVVDGKGKIVARLAGPLTERDLKLTIEPALRSIVPDINGVLTPVGETQPR